jgi:hypothetical protein
MYILGSSSPSIGQIHPYVHILLTTHSRYTVDREVSRLKALQWDSSVPYRLYIGLHCRDSHNNSHPVQHTLATDGIPVSLLVIGTAIRAPYWGEH